MKVRPVYLKPQTSQRREFSLKRLYYMSSPPIFLQLQHVSIQRHFEHTTWGMLRRRTAMNDVMTTKIESHRLYMFCFYKYGAPLSWGLRPAKQLRFN